MINGYEEFKIIKIFRHNENNIIEVIFNDDEKEILGQFLKICSVYSKDFFDDVIAFCESSNKSKFHVERFNVVWEDHPYPDKTISNWGLVDSTKNNLGQLTTLIFDEFGPFSAYSHTLSKVFIIQQLHRSLLNTDQIPKIIEMTLNEFVEILQWWQKTVSVCNNTPSFFLPKTNF